MATEPRSVAWWSAVPVVGGWIEKGVSARHRRHAADVRIADKAERLRRTLEASYEEWAQGPRTKDEFISWAHKLSRGFVITDPGFEEMIQIRPDASKKVSSAIRAARDDYHLAANVINRTVKTTWGTVDLPVDKRVDEAALRNAFAHLRRSIRGLESVSKAD